MILDRLEEAVRRERANVYSLCLVENGACTVRQLAECGGKNNVYSVSKSVTSLVVGILAERGYLRVNGESVADIFRGRPGGVPEPWTGVTPAHLLAHTTGFGGFLDIDVDDFAGRAGEDYLGLVLGHPFRHKPGETMEYSDSNYYLLSRIVTRRTGRGLHDLARELIFNPLGISGTAWAVCPRGYAMGATGLFLGVRDMAKIGAMLLQGGSWNGRQVVPRSWIGEMTRRRTAPPGCTAVGYGYGFWLRRGTDAFSAKGMLGQIIFVSPAKNAVVAVQSCERDGEKMERIFGTLVRMDRAPESRKGKG